MMAQNVSVTIGTASVYLVYSLSLKYEIIVQQTRQPVSQHYFQF